MNSEVGRRRQEHKSLKQMVQIGILSLALIGLFGLPIVNIDNTNRVVSALVEHRSVDCSLKESTNNSRPQALLIPGSQVNFDEKSGKYVPDFYQKRRDKAAAQAYVGGLVGPYIPGGPPVIYLLSGDLGPEVDTEASLRDVQKQVELVSHGKIRLPRQAILVETKSLNTLSNMKEARKILESYGIKNSLVVTDEFHLLRTMLYACANNIHASGISVEELTARFDPTFIAEINAPNHTEKMRFIRAKESLEVLVSMWDRGESTILLKQIVKAIGK